MKYGLGMGRIILLLIKIISELLWDKGTGQTIAKTYFFYLCCN